MSADDASVVISHDAPTLWTSAPKYETRLATHIARKIGERKGARALGPVDERVSPETVLLAESSVIRGSALIDSLSVL
jgi:hypothetical protein